MSSEKSGHVPYVFDENNEKDLASIYRQISVHPDRDFDDKGKEERLIKLLESSLPKAFLAAKPEEVMGDDNRLNLAFVTFIKAASADGLPDPARCFVVFCDWWTLDYNRTYLRLHDKLRALVVRGYKQLIGRSEYQKLENRLNPKKHKTLFDLFGGGDDNVKI